MRPSRAKPAEIPARREKVSSMLIARVNYRAIAKKLDVSLGTIASDVKAMFKRWNEEQIENINEQKLLDLALLDRSLTALYNGVQQGDTQKIATMVRVLERKAKMFGSDAPVQTHMKQEITGAIDVTARQDLQKHTPEELDELADLEDRKIAILEANHDTGE